jgi:hypothetical protein
VIRSDFHSKSEPFRNLFLQHQSNQSGHHPGVVGHILRCDQQARPYTASSPRPPILVAALLGLRNRWVLQGCLIHQVVSSSPDYTPILRTWLSSRVAASSRISKAVVRRRMFEASPLCRVFPSLPWISNLPRTLGGECMVSKKKASATYQGGGALPTWDFVWFGTP